MKTLYCDFNPNDNLYYCSFKKYGSLHPNECLFIKNSVDLFKYIKSNFNQYTYSLPCLVAKEFSRRLGGVDNE